MNVSLSIFEPTFGDHVMPQLKQSNPSVAPIGASEILTVLPAASNRQLSVRSDFITLKKLEAELNEHRYYLDRKVEQRTEQLVKRIKLLESCNTTLCDKLAQAKRVIASLQKQIESNLSGAETNDCIWQPTENSEVAQNQAGLNGRLAA